MQVLPAAVAYKVLAQSRNVPHNGPMCGVKLTSPPFNGVSGGCGGRGQLANSLRFSAAARPMQVLKLLAPLAHAGGS